MKKADLSSLPFANAQYVSQYAALSEFEKQLWHTLASHSRLDAHSFSIQDIIQLIGQPVPMVKLSPALHILKLLGFLTFHYDNTQQTLYRISVPKHGLLTLVNFN